jgi:hypothetical protein
MGATLSEVNIVSEEQGSCNNPTKETHDEDETVGEFMGSKLAEKNPATFTEPS